MKMILPYFENAFGINIFPTLSLILFLAMFVWLIVWVWKTDKNYIYEMKNLPVAENESEPTGSLK